jgi:hypothetical protein
MVVGNESQEENHPYYEQSAVVAEFMISSPLEINKLPIDASEV